MTGLITPLIVFSLMTAGTFAGRLAVTESDVTQAFNRLSNGELELCPNTAEIFCPVTEGKEGCTAGCKPIQACSDLFCDQCRSTDPFKAQEECNGGLLILDVLNKGAVDFGKGSLSNQLDVTLYLKMMGQEFCDDGRFVCDKVPGGCVELDDICNSLGECVCGLGETKFMVDMMLTMDPYANYRRSVPYRLPFQTNH
ncbi:uncharacterized protein [Ptychodera flava]|uniref:uncharacterized protein n=1 Tax=Ptychodera flava TaxID=63121 RepID=UPI00396A983B